MKVAAIKIDGIIKLSYTDVNEAKIQAKQIQQSIERTNGSETIELGWTEVSDSEYQATRATNEPGDVISLFTPYNYPVTHCVKAKIEKETEKAILLKNTQTNKTSWFPKSVLEAKVSICIEGVYRQMTPIAKRLSDEQWKVLQERA